MLHEHKEAAGIRRHLLGKFAQILHFSEGMLKFKAQVGCESVAA
jgi:hypothetical protein